MNLDDAPRWNGKRIDKEIGIMSARSAQRTRWRRWRMGRDIAGRKDRDGRMSGCQAQIAGGDHACALVPLLLLLLISLSARARAQVISTIVQSFYNKAYCVVNVGCVSVSL